MHSKDLLNRAYEQSKSIPFIFTRKQKQRAIVNMLEIHKQALKIDGHSWESHYGR